MDFSYNTPFELRVLESISREFPGAEIVNPRDYQGVTHGGNMDFFYSLIDSCDAIVYSEVAPGYVSAGVGNEVKYGLSKDKLIFRAEVHDGGEVKFRRTEKLEGYRLSVNETRLLNDTVTMFGPEANVDEVNRRLLEVRSRHPRLDDHEDFILACAEVQYENAKLDFPSLEYVLNWRIPRYYKIDTSELVKNLKAPPEVRKLELPVDEMVVWHVDEGLSVRQITKRLRKLGYMASRSTVHRRLRERGVLRDQRTATRLAKTRFPKTPFSDDPSLKAYLLGFREDLNVQRHRRQILIQVSTTHPGMERLFISLFPGWSNGQLYKYPILIDTKIYKGYGYILGTDLHSSFNFLLKKPAEWYWKWTLWAMENRFWDYLADLIDAEGCVEISKKMCFQVWLWNKNTVLLNTLRRKLQEKGFHLGRTGRTKDGTYYFRLGRRSELIRILSWLPLRHPEKLAIKRLILSDKFTRKQKYELYRKYRSYIKQEVKEYVERAKRKYFERRK